MPRRSSSHNVTFTVISGPGRIIATGNAVRRNRLVVEAIERRFARPVMIADTAEEAATGAALAAAIGLDLFKPDALQTQA